MKKSILILYIFLSFNIFSQDNRNFIKLFNDSVIYGNKIEYNDNHFTKRYFTVDSIVYKVEEVAFYRNETGLYANTMHANYGTISFKKMDELGKINVSSMNAWDSYMNNLTSTLPGYYSNSFNLFETPFYYSKEYGKLRNLNYNNLKVDLIDNQNSMTILSEYKTIQKKQLIFSGIATGLIASGAVILFHSVLASSSNNKPINEPLFIGSCVTFGLGSVFAYTSFAIGYNKKKLLFQAIETYNR